MLARSLAPSARTWTLARKQLLVIGCGAGLEALVLATRGAVGSVRAHIPAARELVARNGEVPQLDPVTPPGCCGHDARARRRLPTSVVVIGSDVWYDVVAARGVTRLLTTGLRPQGTALVAEPRRSCGTGAETFVYLMTTAGFPLTSQWISASASARDRRAIA
jgi:hypothetical protein